MILKFPRTSFLTAAPLFEKNADQVGIDNDLLFMIAMNLPGICALRLRCRRWREEEASRPA